MGERGFRGLGTTAYYQGPDAYASQRDMWDVQERNQPRQDLWFYTTRDSYIWWGQSSSHGVDTVDTTYLLPLRPVSRVMLIHEFRCRVTGLGAGGVISCALYAFRQEEKRYLYMLPQSLIEFDAATTGVKSVKIGHFSSTSEEPHLHLDPAAHYFVGYSCNSAAVRFLAIDIPTAAPVVGMREIDGKVGARKKIDLAQTTESTQDHYPHILFLNDIASEIF